MSRLTKITKISKILVIRDYAGVGSDLENRTTAGVLRPALGDAMSRSAKITKIFEIFVICYRERGVFDKCIGYNSHIFPRLIEDRTLFCPGNSANCPTAGYDASRRRGGSIVEEVTRRQADTDVVERLLGAMQTGGQAIVYASIAAVLFQIFGGSAAALALLPPVFLRLVEAVGVDLLAGWLAQIAGYKTLTAEDIQALLARELKKHNLELALSQVDLKYDLLRELPNRDMLKHIAAALDDRAMARAEVQAAYLQKLEVLLQQILRRQLTETLPTAPAPPEHFVGREGELARLAGALTRAERPQAITALQGSGGIGKTALAQMLAAQLQDHFRGGVFWADLAGAGGDPLPLLAGWARLCGQDEGGLAAAAGARGAGAWAAGGAAGGKGTAAAGVG